MSHNGDDVGRMELFRFRPGTTPLIVNVPHAGTHLPPDIEGRLSAAAKALPDTDWHVDRLYRFAGQMGATMLTATHSRYVVDLNRSPDGDALYPGADNTEVCPTTTFDRQAIYVDGRAPGKDEIAERLRTYWWPYHDRLVDVIDRVRERHGRAVLWDAHSIRSRVPRFFEGQLTELNLGTAGGRSCDPELARRLADAAAEAQGYSAVLNGRFTGGYITRTYGSPRRGLQAIQLEQSQITYMDEAPPYGYRDDLARRVQPVIRRLLQTALDWAG